MNNSCKRQLNSFSSLIQPKEFIDFSFIAKNPNNLHCHLHTTIQWKDNEKTNKNTTTPSLHPKSFTPSSNTLYQLAIFFQFYRLEGTQCPVYWVWKFVSYHLRQFHLNRPATISTRPYFTPSLSFLPSPFLPLLFLLSPSLYFLSIFSPSDIYISKQVISTQSRNVILLLLSFNYLLSLSPLLLFLSPSHYFIFILTISFRYILFLSKSSPFSSKISNSSSHLFIYSPFPSFFFFFLPPPILSSFSPSPLPQIYTFPKQIISRNALLLPFTYFLPLHLSSFFLILLFSLPFLLLPHHYLFFLIFFLQASPLSLCLLPFSHLFLILLFSLSFFLTSILVFLSFSHISFFFSFFLKKALSVTDMHFFFFFRPFPPPLHTVRKSDHIATWHIQEISARECAITSNP